MSAVFTGNGLGLFNTSLSQLGYGLGGGAGVGQGRDSQYVNAATGNLVWQSSDEHLVFRGLGVNLTRTYNSLGLLSEVGADGWVTGFERRVALQGGVFNAAGSVMRRFSGDGSYQDFAYVSANTYRSTGGDGAHDTLTWTGSDWRYVEGSTRREEGYADHADAIRQGRLTYLRDLRSDGALPVTWQVDYDASQRIAQLRADDGSGTGDALVFGYDGAGRLNSIATREGGVLRHQVAYEYDGQGRLVGVVTDLTPGNAADNTWNSTNAQQNDGRLFRTQYTYEGTSLRLASVRQGDGTVVSFTYHADGRVKTVTRGDTNANDADGVAETFTYAYAAGSTTVSDSLGRAWVYGFDAEGQLTSLVAPAISGQSDVTTYQYDASGNVLQVRTVRGATVLSQVDYAYDASGNVTWEWDAQGNAISRTWSAGNQLLSLTQYTGVDPDREGAALPTGGLTTRYIHDAQDRLRFVVDALGQVSEFTYAAGGDGIGQQSSLRQYLGASYNGTHDLTGLEAWATSARKASSQLTELSYDAWGRLSLRTEYATVNASGVGVLDSGASLTRYTYDAQGTLRQQITLRNGSRTADGAALAGSQQIDYVYDGLGRLLSSASREIGVSGILLTTYAYLDSGHQVVMTEGGGRVVTQTRDAAGRLVSVREQGNAGGGNQTRTQLNYYDASGQLRASEDAAGGRSYFFYDAKGRLEATVDATGAVTRTYYDGADRVVGTRHYANRLTTGSWLVAGKVVPTQVDSLGIVANASLDRVSGRTYDAAGRLATQTDGLEGSAERSISTYTYDGAGRLLQVRTTDAAGTAGTARVVRYFHDEAGRQVGVLDAEGYLTETQYDRAGRVLSLTRYASASPAAYRATGTLVQLRPGTTGQDQTTRYFHDGRGQLVGVLDAQGYLTEYVIDETWSVRAERRYATAVAPVAGDTLSSLRGQAGTYQQVRRLYDGQGRLSVESNAEGTQTRYTYDAAGRLVKTETAHGTSEVREGHRRYNAFGELIGQISGEGALQLLPGMSEAQLDAIYAQYGVRHSYDVLGRRIESIDAAGNKTWFFHDSAGRLTFTVKAVADEAGLQNARGEVTETRYTAFGDVADTIAYTGRLTIPVPGSRASAANAISTLAYAAAVDTRRQYAYTARGQLAQVIDAENAMTTYAYTAFGDLSRVVAASGTASASTTDHVYDRRGHLIQRTEGVGSGSVRNVGFSYDAFGRVIGEVDGRGTPTAYGYDRLGRQISVTRTVQGRVETVSTTYDAYRRTQVTDARGMVTTYAYDPATQVMTVTSAEGIRVTTAYNRHGQVLTVADAAGRVVTRNTYDRDGLLTSTSDAMNQASTHTYDTRGLLMATVDASGRRVEFRYDAQGRLLQRIEDPGAGKLNRTTSYSYDGQGRQLTVTDASGRVTGYSYDREGRLAQVAQDPAGLNQRTVFAYDAQGRQVTVTEGYGTAAATVTQYVYDALGRRTAEVLDPGAGRLNLTTSYAYDGNDNVIRRTDATGAVTRYYYDEANRQAYAVDALGGLTRNWYDANGRLVATRSAGQALTSAQLASLGDATSLAQLEALRVEGAADAGRYLAYDNDGRLRYSIDLTGAVEQSQYDSAGRLIRTRGHVNRVDLTPALVGQLRAGTATVTVSGSGDDRVSWSVLDEAGRVRYSINRAGNVEETGYDAAGRVAWTRAYATALVLDSALTTKLNAGTAQLADVSSRLTAVDDKDLRLYRIYDAAGRLRFSVDAYGALQKHFTDPAGREVGNRRYAPAMTLDAALLAKLADGTATEQDIAARLGSADSRDLQTYQVYDTAGRVRFIIDIVGDAAGNMRGAVTELFYDAAGRVVARASRETLVDAAVLTPQLPQVRAGTLSASTVAGWLSGASRTTQWVYDAAGRERYTLRADGNGAYTVQERRYDAAGRVVAETVYGVTIPSATALTVEGVSAALVAASGNAAANQRTTRMVYDANGAVRFVLDNLGGVTEQRYDALGRVVAHRQYPVTIPTSTPATEAAVVAAVASQPASSLRITRTGYDSAGRVAWLMDANGATESFEYDAVGNRIRYTNKLGHVWTYAYDAAGRLVEETSPTVTVATTTAAGVVSTSTRTLKTVIAYDVLGNVVSRTEDAAGAQPRITQYQYDNRGNQIRTIFPDAWRINPATGQLEATGTVSTIEVTYNTLNQAVVQKDVNGNYSYKVYDTMGRVTHEVDPEGHVTGYTYNAFGEQSQLRRYANRLNTAGISGFVPGGPLLSWQLTSTVLVADAANDRVVTTTYDSRGLKLQVTQSTISYVQSNGSTASASPITQFSYSAFGELARTSVLLDQAAGTWAHTWQYYDELGRVTLSVDAEGYVTRMQYSVLGEVTEVREYARALSATVQAGLTIKAPPSLPSAGDAAVGYDRVLSYAYDALGRKASESVVRHYGRVDGSQGVRNVTTQWTYDAAGQVVTTDLDGQKTRTTYDALGRVTTVQEAAQQRLSTNAENQLLGASAAGLDTQGIYVSVSACTAMAYDAFGNAVQVTRYANGLQEGQATPVADAANDQVSVIFHDRQGRAVMSQDAQGQRVYLQYDAADRVVHSWYALSGNDGRDTVVHSYYTYDGAGRQLSSRTQRDGASAPDQREAVRYNAFGEIIAKGDDDAAGAALQAQYQYDQAGNLVRSNAEGGMWRDYGYDLAGHQRRESHSVRVGAGNVTAVTRHVNDRLGRTVQMLLPAHSDDVGQVNTLSKQLDRWGNVLALVDPRGYRTTYEYNEGNQLVRQVQPLVKVVTNNAAGTWLQPELTWSYDALGRLIASRDGNGNVTRYEYDGSGKQTRVIDANGSVTLKAYDVFGRERIVQNALGYLTFKNYDRLDRVTAHGDYLPTSNGAARTKKVLESYTLNQNGQRLQVANAMGQTQKYDYDSRGLLLRSQTPTGVIMEYAYDLGGRRALERYALSHSNVLDRDGETVRTNEQSWDYDYFGRLVDHNDLSGRDYDYTYDAVSGQLLGESNSSGLNRTTTYYANGLVRQIQEAGGGTYTYAYDQAGNRTLEHVQVSDSRGKAFNLRTQIVYDSHNRLQQVLQDDVGTGQRMFELTYDYDAAGNRTHVVARSAYGENSLPITVIDQPPEVIGLPANRTIRTGVASEFRVRLADLFRDPEGKPLNVTAAQVLAGATAALPSWLSYSVDSATGEAVFQATAGSSVANNQSFRLRLTASDGNGTAQVEFDLGVQGNTVPSDKAGATITFPVKTGKPWAVELLADDYFVDPDVGDSLAVTATVSPAASWLVIDASNPSVLRLSASAPVAGTYTVTLKATDQQGATRTRAITLVVATNSAPSVVAPIPAQEVTSGRGFVLERDLSQVFVDDQGDGLNVQASLAGGAALPSWLSFSFLGGQAVPKLRFNGDIPAGVANGTVFTIQLTATDPDGGTTSTTFTLTVLANRAPVVIGSLPTQQLRIDQALNLQVPVASLFHDPEGDAMTYELLHPEGTTKSGWMRLELDPANGQLKLLGIPNHSTNHVGTYTVQIRARDIDGSTATMSITFQVQKDTAPTRSSVPLYDQTVKIGRSFSFTLPENLFVDAENDAVSLSLSVATQHKQWLDTIPPQWNYEVIEEPLPAWMNFDPVTRVISGTVPPGTSAHSFMVRVDANDGRKWASQGDQVGAAGQVWDNDFKIDVVPFANSAPVYSNGALPNRALVHGGAVDFVLPTGAFSEPDGDALTYSAEVLVGSVWKSISELGLSIDASTRRITGTASNLLQANYSARIVARDPLGASATGSFSFSVNNTAPTSAAIPTQTLARSVNGSFSVAAYFSDANGDALTFSASGLPAGLSISTSGVISGAATAALGNYTVTITADDGRGGAVSASFTLALANSVPTAPAIANQTATAGSNWSYTVPAFTDPNGDALVYTATGLPAWMAFNASSRVLSGVPRAMGSWTVTITATDPSGASVSRAFTVTTPNVAPVLSVAIPSQSASRNKAWSYQIPAGTFIDANGDVLTYSVGALPAGISFNAATRTFSGTPTVLGNHSIAVTVNDGNGGSRTTNMLLSVVNAAPVYSGGLSAKTVQKGQSITWPLPAGTFTDANGDGLTYSLMVEHPGYNEIYWDARDAAWMVRWIEPSWFTMGSDFSINSTTGTISGVPPIFYAPVHPVLGGTPELLQVYRVKITASDGSGGAAEGIFSVKSNLPPVMSAQLGLTVKAGAPWGYVVPAFSDPNGDALTYSVSNLPAGVSFNAATRTLSGSVAVAGTYTITITANDGKGGTGSTSFVLTVQANTAPTAPAVPNQTATVGTAFSYGIPAFSDADYDNLTYSATGIPPGLSFSTTNLVLSGTPTTAGAYTVTVTANDGRGGSVSRSFTVTVSSMAVPNRAPVINVQAPATAYHFFSTNRWVVYPEGFTLPANTFVDPDNNPLTYSIVQKPYWLDYSFDQNGHRFYGVNGDTRPYFRHIIILRATDPSGAYVDMTFAVTSEHDEYDPWNPTDPLRSPLQAFVADEIQATESESTPEVASTGSAGITTLAAAAPNIQESWYAYDKLNRVVVNNGVLENGQVVAAKNFNYSSYGVSYDAAGNVVAQTQWRSNGAGGWRATIIQQTWSLRGELLLTWSETNLDQTSTARVIERRTYDDAGRMTQQLKYFSPGTIYHWVDWERTPMTTDVSGMLVSAELTSYDADGRVVGKEFKERPSAEISRAPYGSNAQWTFPAWVEAMGLDPGSNQYDDLAVLSESTWISYSGGNNGYDEAGRVKGYTYTGKGYTHTYTYAYAGWDSYREQSVTGSSSNSNYKTTTTTLTYDTAGRQIEMREKTVGAALDDRVRTFALDGNGMIVSRRDGTVTSANVFQQTGSATAVALANHHFVHAGGQQVATLNEWGRLDVRSHLTAFSNSDSGRTQVTVQSGDTLRSLAQRVYGNESLWYVIAAANALDGDSGDGPLVAGSSLTVPEVKTSSNDAGTFKPYNPGEISGPSTPSLPYIQPPSDSGCGKLGMVIMVVVAVVVSVVTYGQATQYFSSVFSSTIAAGMATGATVGAAASLASNAVGSAMGVTSFSWANVAAGAATGAITGGLAGRFGSIAEALGSNSYGQATALALANAGGNYAGQKLMGTDAGFSWRSIAASAVGSLVSAKVTPGLVDKMRIQDKFGYDFASGMTGGMVSAGVRSSFGQTLRQGDYMTVVADAFGNALGSSIANSAAQERELEMKGRISTDMRGVNNRLSEQMEIATDGVAQSHLDRMLGAATDRNLLDATTRFQTQLDVDYARWESAARARVAAEMAARARATSAAPAGFTGASFDYSGFIADRADALNRNRPSYMKSVEERYGIGRMPAMSLANDPRLDPVTRQPLPQMQAADDTWTLARARGERELKARQNMAALDERVGAALAFFGPTYDNGTVSGQLINPITGQRVSNSQREEAIGDILGITTMFVGPSALGRSVGAGRLEVANKIPGAPSSSFEGLGNAATSPWLADSRVGVRLHVESFRDGGSFLIPKSAWERFNEGKALIGDPTGQFITTRATMDKILFEAGGDLAVVKQKLGIPERYWNEEILRVDVHNPLMHNARFPSGFERGANEQFRWGGYTSGGQPEVVLDQIPKAIMIDRIPKNGFTVTPAELR